MLSAGRDIQFLVPIERWHFDARSQRRLRKCDRHLTDQIVVMPAEKRVLFDSDVAMQIAMRSAADARFAFTHDADGVAFVNAWGNLDFEHALLILPTGATTGRAMFANHRAAPSAIG